MTIERKSGLFYELMIRGNWDPQQGALGRVMTYQLQTGSCLVDTATNMLAAPYAPDPARDLTKEEAIEFLGEKFADFLDQLSETRTAAQAAAKQAAADIAARDKQITELRAANAELTPSLRD